jgi:hypothetical protein
MDPETRKGHFDRAVAYFNAGRFYEAHEDWEILWLESEDEHRLWLQGLIQYAAALVHYSRGFHARGFSRLLEQATEKVTGYEGETEGLDWPRLERDLVPWIEHGKAVTAGADLVKDAPQALPKVPMVEGYEPTPLPLEDEEED